MQREPNTDADGNPFSPDMIEAVWQKARTMGIYETLRVDAWGWTIVRRPEIRGNLIGLYNKDTLTSFARAHRQDFPDFFFSPVARRRRLRVTAPEVWHGPCDQDPPARRGGHVEPAALDEDPPTCLSMWCPVAKPRETPRSRSRAQECLARIERHAGRENRCHHAPAGGRIARLQSKPIPRDRFSGKDRPQ